MVTGGVLYIICCMMFFNYALLLLYAGSLKIKTAYQMVVGFPIKWRSLLKVSLLNKISVGPLLNQWNCIVYLQGVLLMVKQLDNMHEPFVFHHMGILR